MRIGLTGGIASGKSTLGQMLRDRGIPVVDADEVSRDVMRPGSPLFSSIVEAFGSQVLNAEGTDLDRTVLGEKVFGDESARQKLNQLSHPVIWEAISRQVCSLEETHPIVVVMVPLLLENGRQDFVDEVWVVALPLELQKARLMSRNRLTEPQASARIASQMPLEARIALADRVIDNSGSLEDTRRQLEQALLDLSR